MLAFWGKSARDGDVAPMHSVPHHSLDVAACAFELAPILPPPTPLAAATVAALVALHDVGKFTRTFQAKAETLWPEALLGGLQRRSGPPHDQAGYVLLADALEDALAPLFVRWEPGANGPLLRALAGHHGRPPCTAHDRELPRYVACPACLGAARAFIAAVCGVIAPEPLPPVAEEEIHALAWWLAGFTTLADWVGSGRRWFPPVNAGAHADLAAYWRDRALPRARRAIAEAGLAPCRPAGEGGLAGLFPEIAARRPLQQWAEEVPLPDGPGLFVIEDATGAGKTEAALVLAHRLMRAGRGDGLYVALPTMATANAMYARLSDAYARLFEPGEAPRRPSLVLAHGRRMLDPRFAGSIRLDLAAEDADDDAPDPEAAADPASAQCAAWLADDRRKAFLAEIGVGTIDQALMAVLPVRHAALRLLGLSRRVLIVDEAHAYDAYVSVELMRLLHFHAALGGSAIVLSATLTARQRTRLAAEFRAGLREPPAPLVEAAYPLATVVARNVTREQEMASAMRRRVAVERVPDAATAADALLAAADAGAAVAWVRNTVDDAIAAAALLAARGARPMLFHARFAMGHRLAIEEQVLRRFGKHAAPAERRGSILVATQVIEQSLDLDFDLMVSDLAPADLVIQRAGRLWRHPERARVLSGSRLLLLAPEPVEDPPAGWLGEALRGTGFVYADPALLWRSARALLGAGHIVTPDNIRALVEAAYDRDAPGAVPAAFAKASLRAQGRESGEAGMARLNVLRFDEPYSRDSGAWEPDTRTPTRLGEAQTVLRLARIEAGRMVPLCAEDGTDASRRAWALSEVSVRATRVAGVPPDPEADALLEPIRAGWGKWERDIPVLVLRGPAEGPWQGTAVAVNGDPGTISYCRTSGLTFALGGPTGRS